MPGKYSSTVFADIEQVFGWYPAAQNLFKVSRITLENRAFHHSATDFEQVFSGWVIEYRKS